MLDYTVSFYNEYIFLFYFFTIIAVLLEGPIVILTLSLLSAKLGIPFWVLIILALIGDFGGDLLHFFGGKYFKKLFLKNKKIEKFEKIKQEIDKISLFEKLIIIKYTPPITSIGLIYLGLNGEKTWNFIKNDFPLCIFSSALVLFIGYNFGEFFKENNNLYFFFLCVGLVIFLTIFISKIIGKIVIKKIYKNNKIKNDS